MSYANVRVNWHDLQLRNREISARTQARQLVPHDVRHHRLIADHRPESAVRTGKDRETSPIARTAAFNRIATTRGCST